MMNIAVFCSGNGTNLAAIINAVKKKKLKAHIALVLSDNEEAFALTRAARAGIKHVVVKRSSFVSRSDFEKEIITHLAKEKVELIVLAGFMRILGCDLLSAYRNRIINIHPALLPSFKGAHGIKDAFDYGAKVTGVTIHFVDDEMDHGPIIIQEAVPIRAHDTLKTLEQRIHKVEHSLYYKAIALFTTGRLKIKGRKVIISDGKKMGTLLKGVSPFFVLFLGAVLCFAEAPLVVSASVDKTTLAADEVVELTITIKGADSATQEPKIDLPKLEDNFTIVASTQSSNITMRGTQTQLTWQLRYSLVPKKEGSVTIESARVVYGGKTYSTDALTLTITSAKKPLLPSPPEKEHPQKFPWSDKEGIDI